MTRIAQTRATLPASFFPRGAARGCPRAAGTETSGAQLKGEPEVLDTVTSRLLQYEMTPKHEEEETAFLLSLPIPHPTSKGTDRALRSGTGRLWLVERASPAGVIGGVPQGATFQDMTKRGVRKSEVSHG